MIRSRPGAALLSGPDDDIEAGLYGALQHGSLASLTSCRALDKGIVNAHRGDQRFSNIFEGWCVVVATRVLARRRVPCARWRTDHARR